MGKRNRRRSYAAGIEAGLAGSRPQVIAAARQLASIAEAAAVQEAVRGDLVPIDEARLRGDGTVPIKIIGPGWGSSGYYSAQVLEQAGVDRVFPAGTQMFCDHPTITERSDRPERSLRDLAAVLESDARWDPNHVDGPGLYSQARIFETFRPALAEMAPHIGLSIRAAAEITSGEAEGRRGRIVERIVEGVSVDFVTKAGRGGKVLQILEAARGLSEAWTEDLRSALNDALRDRFPTDDGSDCWSLDHDPETSVVVFRRYGEDAGTYELGYTLDDDGNVTLADGDPVAVRVTTTYTPIGEARSIGQWIESHLHLHFTRMCDEMAAEGRLSRPERITLSSAIGDALGVFVSSVEQAAPQLYQRDLFEEPAATTTTEESMDKAEIKVMVDEAVQAANAPLQETIGTLQTELTETKGVNDKLKIGILVRDAREAARGELVNVALPKTVLDKIVETVSLDPPVTEDGALDTAKLAEAVKAETKSWVDVLVEAGAGSTVRNLGGGDITDLSAEKTNEALEATFVELGMSDVEAKAAVADLG